MQFYTYLAHAGEEHSSEIGAAAHSNESTLIIVVTALALVAASLVINYLSKKSNPKTAPESQKN